MLPVLPPKQVGTLVLAVKDRAALGPPIVAFTEAVRGHPFWSVIVAV